MKYRLLFVTVLGAILAFGLTWTIDAKGLGLGGSIHGLETANDPLTLDINLGREPSTLDPALSINPTSNIVIEQLFVGLVDVDDESGELQPELATNWTISTDGLVYTFNLRNDIKWSDGKTVIAEDVRYGILRALDPNLETGYAYVLYVIDNAEAYNTGDITDPNEVGVTVVNSTTLEIKLEYPASYFFSILSMPIARPVPQWAIDAHGSDWTELGNIVTSGPYLLTEWVHDDHIILDKNPNYYDVSNLQIDRVMMWMESDASMAWQMYLDDELDTVGVSQDAELDPVLNQQSEPVLLNRAATASYYQPLKGSRCRVPSSCCSNCSTCNSTFSSDFRQVSACFTPEEKTFNA